MINDFTVDNDLDSKDVGKVVYAPDYGTVNNTAGLPNPGSLCGNYRFSPKAVEIEFLDFAKNEPESINDIQEMADNMHLDELDKTAEWLSGALSAILKARAKKMRSKYGLQA
jgi:hypothetical protein